MKVYQLKHGRTYSSWAEMRQRCYNPNNVSYHNYGGRGVEVCEEWNDYKTFLLDMGVRPENMTLDRIDVQQGYYKDNCRWATPKQQLRNTRANRMISHNGLTKCLAEWAEEYGLKPVTLAKRIREGWTMEAALTEKVNATRKGVAHNQKPVTFQGKTQTLKKWAEEYN